MMSANQSKSAMNREGFNAALRDIGMSEEQALQFHKSFENNNSHEHRVFLEFLGLGDDEIAELIKNLK